MNKIKYKAISIFLLFLITISIMEVIGEEQTSESLCYAVPDTVRSLSLVSNGIYTAAVGVGENPEIFITDPDGVVWACPKRALSILLTPDGKYSVVGMNNGVELYDNSNAVDTTVTKILITVYVSGAFTKGQTKIYQAMTFPKITKEIIETETTCNPVWKYTIDEETRVLAISETASYIFAGAADTLYVVDRQGKLSWKYKADSAITDIETVGRYVVTSSQKTVYLFNISGDLLWTYSVNGMPEQIIMSTTGPYVGVGTDSGHIYLLDKNGSLLWDYKNSKAVHGLSITNTGSYLVAGSKDGYVLFFNNKGTKLWSYKTKGEVNFVDISSQGQYVGVGADRDSYYIFNWNGQKLWAKTNPENYFWAIQVNDDGKGIFGGSGKYMGGNEDMKLSNTVCFFNTEAFAKADDAPDKNTQTTTTTPTEITTTTQTTNKLPTANAGSDFETKVGDAVRFDGTKSTDEDGNVVSYKWDFGDGATSIDGEPLHQYTTAGVFKVTLTVTDDKGESGQDVVYVTVKDAQSPVKGVPGFELPAVLGGSAVAYYLISRRKRNK